MVRVAFDIDDTLWRVRDNPCPEECRKSVSHNHFDQVPDYDLIQVLRWFVANGDEVIVWSAGGVDYAKAIMTRFGLDELVTILPKETRDDIDISFDDMEVKLAKANVRITRPNRSSDEASNIH